MNWSEMTAISTAAFAALTLALVIAAFIAARYAKRDIEVQLKASHDDLRATREATQVSQATAQRQIEVSQHQLEVAQRQFEASYRPLLIDVVRSGSVSENDRVLIASDGRIKVEFPDGHVTPAIRAKSIWP